MIHYFVGEGECTGIAIFDCMQEKRSVILFVNKLSIILCFTKFYISLICFSCTRHGQNISSVFLFQSSAMKAVVLAIEVPGKTLQTDGSLNFVEFCNYCSNCIDLSLESSFYFCTKCNLFCHRRCTVSRGRSEEKNWSCPRCNQCSCCSQLITAGSVQCSTCHRSFHKSAKDCTASRHNEVLGNLDDSCWKCADCLKCKYCQATQPEGSGWSDLKGRNKRAFKNEAKWMDNNESCNECFLMQKKGNQCPLCLKLYRDDDEEVPMIICDKCDHWIHLSCDSRLTLEDYERLTENEESPYVCTLCDKTIIQPIQKIANNEYSGKENVQNSSHLIQKPNVTPYFLMICVLCRRRETDSDFLQLLSPLDIPYYDDCCMYLNCPDLFIHQKCLFYLIVGSKRPKTFEVSRGNQLHLNSIDVYRRIKQIMQIDCSECLGVGASIQCNECNACFHYFCGESHSHPWKPFFSKTKIIQNFVLERRYLHSIWTKIGVPTGDIVVKLDGHLCNNNLEFFKTDFGSSNGLLDKDKLKDQNCSVASTPALINIIHNNSDVLSGKIFSSSDQIDSATSHCTQYNSLSNRIISSASSSLSNYDYSVSRLSFWNRDGINPYRSKCHYRSTSDLIVTPSRIAGIGVVAGKTFNPGEPVIEYVGELIGRAVANQREKLYEQHNRGCYMFKIDDDCIVDATMTGNKARFINHSCGPNCRTKHVPNIRPSDGHIPPNKKRIIIYAAEKIEIGDEFSYDYMFQREEAKIPCKCSASLCRGFMN